MSRHDVVNAELADEPRSLSVAWALIIVGAALLVVTIVVIVAVSNTGGASGNGGITDTAPSPNCACSWCGERFYVPGLARGGQLRQVQAAQTLCPFCGMGTGRPVYSRER